MKRCIIILLALLLLTSCGGKGQAPDREKDNPSSSVSETVPAPSAPDPETAEPDPDPVPDPEPSSQEQPEGADAAEPDTGDRPLSFSLGPQGEAKALHAGDTLGSWTLQSYDARWEEGQDIPRVDDAIFTAPADAPVEMTCTVYLNPMSWEDRIYCFDVAQEDWDKLPVLEGTDRSIWFRAGNSDQLEQLETMDYEDRWECRVAVSRYDYSHLPMAAADIAEIAWVELR